MSDTKDGREAILNRSLANQSPRQLYERAIRAERRADALERERDGYKRDVEAIYLFWGVKDDDSVALRRRMAEAQAVVRRADALERALRPFAEAVGGDPDPNDPRDYPDQHAWEHPYAMDVKVGDFQQARAVLAQQEPDQPTQDGGRLDPYTLERAADVAKTYRCTGGEGDPIAESYRDGVNSAAQEIAHEIENLQPDQPAQDGETD
jgi:hypothetical protein